MSFDEVKARASSREFSERAKHLQIEAERLCAETPDSDLDEWMQRAKHRGMTYVEGLAWTVTILSK